MKSAISQYEEKKNQYISIIERAIPVPSENEVLIKVQATSLNFADLAAIKGEYHALPSEGFIPGFDCAGSVVQNGKHAGDFSIGDRVAGFPQGGAFAEYVCVDQALVYPIDEAIPYPLAAASISTGITAYELVHKAADVKKTDTVVIHAAAGGVGLLLIQLAKMKGATVIGVVGSFEKQNAAEAYGADHTIQHNTEDFAAQVMNLTGGRGADVLFDSIGGETAERSLQCTAPYGKLITFGHASGKTGLIRTADLHSFSKSVIGYSSGQRQKKCPEALRESANHFFDLLTAGKVKICIAHQLKMKDANTAFQIMSERKLIGKIVLTF